MARKKSAIAKGMESMESSFSQSILPFPKNDLNITINLTQPRPEGIDVETIKDIMKIKKKKKRKPKPKAMRRGIVSVGFLG